MGNQRFLWAAALMICGISCASTAKNDDTSASSDEASDSNMDTSSDTESSSDTDTSSQTDTETDTDTGTETNTETDPAETLHDCVEPRYTALQVVGWEVCIESALLADEQGDAVLALLTQDLNQVVDRLEEDVVYWLQDVRIWVELESDWQGAVYHPSADWLQENGYPTHWAESIQIANAANYLSWTSIQPAIVLHELSHAWHHQHVGYNSPGIISAYDAAMESGIYDDVAYAGGGTAEAYAKTNALEYFAELSEAWFWQNDFYPFTREELLAFDPLGAEAVESAWSTD